MKHRPSLSPITVKLMSPGGAVKAEDEFVKQISHKSTAYEFKVVVIKERNCTNLLSRDLATKMGLIIRVDEIEEHNMSDPDIGLMEMRPVKIHLRDDAMPVSMITARRVTFQNIDECRKGGTGQDGGQQDHQACGRTNRLILCHGSHG